MYKIHNLTDEESTLLEPAACAIHGLDKLNPPVGIEVLLLGAGPTGLILAQLLKLNGASRVVIAANKGIKMDIAKKLNAADEYIELDRKAPEAQWQKLKDDNPYGFDVVVEATGVEKLANESINYVRRGGTLMIYGVYEDKALVHWPPSKVRFVSLNMITILMDIHYRFSETKSRYFYSSPNWVGSHLSSPYSDHWLFLADLLFPTCRGLPRRWKDQCQGHGDRCFQTRRLSSCFG